MKDETKLRAMLDEAAQGDDPTLSTFAKKLLDAFGAGDDDAKSDNDGDEEDAPPPAAAKPSKSSAVSAHVASRVASLEEKQREQRKQRRAEILATLPKAIALSLATEKLEVIERVASRLPRRAEAGNYLAAADQPGVLASVPRGKADPNQPRPPRTAPEVKAKLDERMGLKSPPGGIVRSDNFVELGFVPNARMKREGRMG